MKYLLIISLLFLYGNTVFAQWSEEELAPYREKAARIVSEFVKAQVESKTWHPEDDSLAIAFTTDTMQIEQISQLLNDDGHYSTMEMNFTLSFMLDEYDKLLNKYYKVLMKKLSTEDRIKLRDAQRLWLKYRDSEKKINNEMVATNPYAGGGTMWPLVAGERNLHILKERLFSIYELIEYF